MDLTLQELKRLDNEERLSFRSIVCFIATSCALSKGAKLFARVGVAISNVD